MQQFTDEAKKDTNFLIDTFDDPVEFMKSINRHYEKKTFSFGGIFAKFENEITEKVLEKIYMEDNEDMVNNPSHYSSKNGLEVIDIIDDFELGYNLGNVVKYVLRHTRKGGIQDLKKAVWYLNHEIQTRMSEQEEEDTCPPF